MKLVMAIVNKGDVCRVADAVMGDERFEKL